MFFCLVQNFFSDNTRVTIFIFFCRAKRQIFFQKISLGYMTKTLNQIIFFIPTCRKSLTNLSHNELCCIEYTSSWTGFDITTLVVITTDCTGSCKSNYHMIKTTMTSCIMTQVGEYYILLPSSTVVLWIEIRINQVDSIYWHVSKNL